MGWKSTQTLSRSEAIKLILEYSLKSYDISNRELEEMLYSMEFGDNSDLPYYGCNFTVEDDE